jgi:hypothetical protein
MSATLPLEPASSLVLLVHFSNKQLLPFYYDVSVWWNNSWLMNWKYLEGGSLYLIEVLSWNFAGGTEENHKKPVKVHWLTLLYYPSSNFYLKRRFRDWTPSTGKKPTQLCPMDRAGPHLRTIDLRQSRPRVEPSTSRIQVLAFLPHCFQFIIHLFSYHSTVCSPPTKERIFRCNNHLETTFQSSLNVYPFMTLALNSNRSWSVSLNGVTIRYRYVTESPGKSIHIHGVPVTSFGSFIGS